MDFLAIWNAITENLATVSLFSVGGLLGVGIKWVYHRFNKRHLFKMLRGDAVEVVRAVSFYQQSEMQNQNLDARASYTVETLDTLVEMLCGLQDRLGPLKIYLFRESEMTTHWLLAEDMPKRDGSGSSELGKERIREIGVTVRCVSRLMRAGDYRKAKKEFPSNYDVAKKRIRSQIKESRTEATIQRLKAHGIEGGSPSPPCPRERLPGIRLPVE